MPHDDYPESVVEVLDDAIRFKRGVLTAMRDFHDAKPWRGTVDERKEKFVSLNHDLAGCYNRPAPDLVFERINGSSSARSHYDPRRSRIVLVGKLSVCTYLHEMAHALGKNEWQACRWSINLFRKIFPRQFARLVQRGHMLIRPEDL